jgi:transcriptional regulator with GAF, ATPase, and Fis domain
LIKVNCAALSPSIIESEFFGHEKGSFTGAIEKRIGKFELANKSSIFLDEIGELPLEMQAKLLRFLQEKEIERVGGNHTIKLDVRIIAATNRDLEKEVEAGKFRQDLFYRLCVFPIKLPALRERVEDLRPLIKHFVNKYCIKFNKSIEVILDEIYPALESYHWPGNVRELEFMIERAILLNTDKVLKITDFNLSTSIGTKEAGVDYIKKWFDIEREILEKVMIKTNGKIRGKGGAADLLGLKPTTLESKLKKLGVLKTGNRA